MICDKDKFERILTKELCRDREAAGFSTFAEKLMHSTLKHYYEPDEDYHEVPCAGAVADIMRDGNIIEIQTRAMRNIPGKLEKFLPAGYTVTVVYPIAASRRLLTTDSDTGEFVASRRAGRGERLCGLLPELWYIRNYAAEGKITLEVPLLSVDEYRRKSTREKYSRKGYFLLERSPTGLLDIATFSRREDYLKMLPDTLGEEFTAKEFAKECGLRAGMHLSMAIAALSDMKLIGKCGKRGNAFVYKRLMNIEY